MLRTFLLLAVASALLGGCGGRAARPIPTQQSFDADMSCPQLAAELASNKTSINRLNGELGDLDGQNAAVLVGVILAGPGMLFALDNGDAQQKEIAAFQTRNARLTELGAARDCGDLATLAPATGTATAIAPAPVEGTTLSPLATQPSTTASAGTTTSGAAVPPLDPEAARPEFEAWMAANKTAFMAELTRVGRAEGFSLMEAGQERVIGVSLTRVEGRGPGRYLVDLDYEILGGGGWVYRSTQASARVLVTLSEGKLVAIEAS